MPMYGRPSMKEARASKPEEASGPHQWQPSGEAAKLLGDSQDVIPIVGAGVSAAAGFPGTNDFLKALLSRFRPAPGAPQLQEHDDFFGSVDKLVCGDIEREEQLQAFTADFYGEAVAHIEPESIAFYLIHVPSRLIVTLNYDRSLEIAADEIRVDTNSLYGEKGIRAFIQLAQSPSRPNEPTILHLHGSVDNPDGIVLTQGSYQDLSQDNLEKLFAALRKRRMCVLGSNLREPHLLGSLERVNEEQPSNKPHPFFAADPGSFIGDYPGLETRAGLRVFQLPSREHIHGLAAFLGREAVLPSRLLELESTDERTESLPARGPSVEMSPDIAPSPDTADAGYVPNVLVEEHGEESDHERSARLAQAILNAGRRRRSFPEMDGRVWTEQQLANSARNVVVGAPGSGKTELMRHTAMLSAPNQRSLVIPLREVSLVAGDAATRLTRWASKMSTDSLRKPSRQEIEEDTFHFLLDGLDEVAIPNQDRVAQMIVALADAYPRHSFTVSSRPIPALGAFDPTAWNRLELNPGTTWRERYLQSRGGPSFEDLVSTLESGTELIDLLELPFFLVQVVEMFDSGDLHEMNLWSCLGELVTQALAREEAEDRLPLDSHQARTWLQDAALAMQLAGRTAASIKDLSTVSPHSGVQADTAEIAEGLVQRSMLRRSGDEYAFTHRIIGEALAAEALLRRGPSEELLDAIVPNRNELVRGVRNDWQVSLTLSMLADSRWRDAVKARDPLNWARAVPASAEHPERREAALLIWRTYSKWKIWLWEREEPEILHGVASLGRHLAANDLPEVIEEIQEGLDDPSAQIQGNSIRVLSQGKFHVANLEGDLRRVLEDDSREPVVRRQAAMAAADLGSHSLLPALIKRANQQQAQEDSESQTCAYAISDLVQGEDELVAAATEVLDSKEARFVLLLRVEERATPQNRLHFLRRYAAVDQEAYSTEKERLFDLIEDLGTPNAQQVEEIAEIAGIWELSAEELKDAFAEHKVAAVRGLGRGLEEADGKWWRAFALLHMFSPEELEDGGAPEEMVERRRSQITNAGLAPLHVPRRRQESDATPTLVELLGEGTETADLDIMSNAHYFSNEAKELDPDGRSKLLQRLETWWSGRILEAIQEQAPNRWTIARWASAWLWLAPAIQAPLNTERWGEIARAEPLYDEQTDWLQSQASEVSVSNAVRDLDSRKAKAWSHLLKAAGTYATDELLDSLVEQLDPEPEESGYVEEIATTLTDRQDERRLQALAKKSSFLQTQLRPYRASLGDAASIRELLHDLALSLRESARSERGFQWLNGLTDNQFLDQLFECLALANEGHRSPRDGLWEVQGALQEAIRRIGGEAAVRGYDRLLTNEEFRFARLQRNVIVYRELMADGLIAAARAAASAGVPLLPQPTLD